MLTKALEPLALYGVAAGLRKGPGEISLPPFEGPFSSPLYIGMWMFILKAIRA